MLCWYSSWRLQLLPDALLPVLHCVLLLQLQQLLLMMMITDNSEPSNSPTT